MSSTNTRTETFNVTHARKLAAKVVADMHQCNLLYGKGPAGTEIAGYEQELVAMLAGGYVRSYEFGFQTADDKRVLAWKYTVGPSGDLEGGRSGGLYAQASLAGTSMFNFLTTSSKWTSLPAGDRAKVEAQHSVNRVTGSPPADGNGYWSSNRSYAAGGVAVTRQEFRPL
jgi:hypothetical protein